METIQVNAEYILTLENKNQWIHRIPNLLPHKKTGADEFLFVDNRGNFMAIGEDFRIAEEKGYYPVKVYRLIRTVEFASTYENE